MTSSANATKKIMEVGKKHVLDQPTDPVDEPSLAKAERDTPMSESCRQEVLGARAVLRRPRSKLQELVAA
jgi:hypothetical protein